jgi:hypothetical protein
MLMKKGVAMVARVHMRWTWVMAGWLQTFRCSVGSDWLWGQRGPCGAQAWLPSAGLALEGRRVLR